MYTLEILQIKNIKELKEILKKNNVKGISRLNKKYLIEKILKTQLINENISKTTNQIEFVEQLNQKKIIKITYKQLYEKQKKRIHELERQLEQKNNELDKLKSKEIEDTNNQTAKNSKDIQEPNSITTLATNLINKKHKKKQKRDIWGNSKWKNICNLENDDVGSVGEEIIDEICKKSQIVSEINGTKTKQVGGGIGDGKIKGENL